MKEVLLGVAVKVEMKLWYACVDKAQQFYPKFLLLAHSIYGEGVIKMFACIFSPDFPTHWKHIVPAY